MFEHESFLSMSQRSGQLPALSHVHALPQEADK